MRIWSRVDCDGLHFLEVLAERGAVGELLSGATEHGADGRQDLAKFIVQLTGDMAERGFLGGDELLREVAALLG